MNEIFAIGLQAMHSDMARLDHTAANLANALTPGYKRAIPVQSVGQAGGFAAAMASAGNVQSAIDRADGTLKATGQLLDLAISGEGFFEVVTPAGPAYTRQGNFRMDGKGRLVTQAGHAVAGEAGDIVLSDARPEIARDGTIAAAPGATPQRVRIVRFDAGTALRQIGDGLSVAAVPGRTAEHESVRIRQGYLENSNVNAAREMTQLVQTMRHFETMQKVVQSADEMLGTAIRKLGDTV